jgi:hypothetical protein
MYMEPIKLGFLISLQMYFTLSVIMICLTELQNFTQNSFSITGLDLTVHKQHLHKYVLESGRPGLSPSAVQLE